MSAARRCHVSYALLIGGLVSATGYGATIAQPGWQGVQASDSNQKRDDRQQSGVVQDGRFVTSHRDSTPPRGAPGNILKPAIAARPGLSLRSDPVAAGARGFGAASAGVTGRPSSTVLSAASRSVAGLKPLAAGNGVIGGPRAAGRGMIGGAVNGKSVLKASIDGTALRRRF
jgi:hypothetical protein